MKLPLTAKELIIRAYFKPSFAQNLVCPDLARLIKYRDGKRSGKPSSPVKQACPVHVIRPQVVDIERKL